MILGLSLLDQSQELYLSQRAWHIRSKDLIRLGRGRGGGRGVGGWRAGKTSFALFCVFPCLAFLFTDTEGMGRSGQGGCGGDSSVIKGLQRTLIRYAHNCRVLTLPFCAFASCWSHYRGLNSVVVLGLRSRGCNLYRSRSFDSLLLLLL